MYDNEKKLKTEADLLQKTKDQIYKELLESRSSYDKLKEDMDLLTKNHEEEVQLRLQFESKLNSLHALHRDVKAKYQRATEDIFNLETFNNEKTSQVDELKEEVIQLRAKKIENESLIVI